MEEATKMLEEAKRMAEEFQKNFTPSSFYAGLALGGVLGLFSGYLLLRSFRPLPPSLSSASKPDRSAKSSSSSSSSSFPSSSSSSVAAASAPASSPLPSSPFAPAHNFGSGYGEERDQGDSSLPTPAAPSVLRRSLTNESLFKHDLKVSFHFLSVC